MSNEDLRRLPGKIAIVTGGSSGIGRATVELFVRHGAKVVSIDLDDPAEPETPYPQGIVFVKGSVTDEHVWANAIDAAKSLGGVANILVQCAGLPGRERLLDTTMDSWNRVLNVNCTSIMYGMQVFIRALVEAKRPGSIVNVSSLAGVIAMGAGIAYEASKAACTHMSKTVAWEYAEDGIRANCVAPGLTITGLCLKQSATFDP
ncbi:hypothetical protein I317_06467 [Kwoniella heveanensis CBS 569]|uniref:Ketoreductase domain-containing protein n=1 Tax=Kwoniella heveanensis BCC8398 TaxID=1296120 RepID=A0A1B9GMA0_9TREE|nr:hypothetical protein I316_06164 [Kwoniella heveanensis BCC8398]OCF39743.1 hypothetical protein I317_06467 [Kwoniella heveanensis CBS 569]